MSTEGKLAFKINEFEGPLDLLLHLIDKNKFNIFDIPIVEITEQYLDYVNKMQETDLDIMSEFLVMAATLISIKAKMLLPKEEKEEEEEDDPRAELVRRLLEYKMYKYASYELKDMELDAEKSFYKSESIPKEVREYKEEIDPAEVIGDTTLAKLNEIFNQVIRRTVDRIDPIRSKFGTIEKEEVRIEDKMEEIRSSIKGLKGINFRTLLEVQASKINVIVTFLAILELMKVGDIVIKQEGLFGDIIIDSLEID
ncbi:MAG: segregation/condensation protein A [Lachnospiraceae bacterium]|nr:segregation/condensation protein A [Lachnospiraceae bacterium]